MKFRALPVTSPFLVALPPVLDLLLCAKYLFVAARKPSAKSLFLFLRFKLLGGSKIRGNGSREGAVLMAQHV
jgi:hypothetical protein